MCLTVNPAGDSAVGIFQASASAVFMTLQWVAKRDVTSVDGLVDFRRVADEWRVHNVWIKTGIQW